MAIEVKLQPLSLELGLMLRDVEQPTLRSTMLADFARQEIKKAEAINEAALGHATRYKTFVDGSLSTDLNRVRPDGTIVAAFELFEDAIQTVGDLLRQFSPVGRRKKEIRPGHPGLYRASHVLMADGEAIEWAPGQPLPPADTYAFVNSQPYARKIERGLSHQRPTGVYQTVATMAKRRLGNVANVRFSYMAPLFGAVHGWAETTPMASPGRRGAQRAEWLRRQPAILISVR